MPTSEKRFLNCPITAKTMSDCDPVAYIIKVGFTIAPGIIIGMFCFMSIFLVCCFRFCCNCCGGREQTANVCCPPSKDKNIPARYSTKDILRSKLLMFAVAGVAVGAIVWGNAVASQVVSGLKGFGDAVQGIPDHVWSKVVEMNESLTLPVYTASTNTTTTVALFENSSVMTEARKVRDTLTGLFKDSMGDYQRGIDDFSFVLFIIFSVPSAVVVAGAPLALLNIRRWLPMLLAWLTFLLAMIVWTVHGAFAGTAFVVDGLCTEVSGIANNRRNIVSPLVGCSSSTFTDYVESFRKLRREQAQQACKQFAPLCYNSSQSDADNLKAKQVYDCGASSTINCTGKDLPDVAETILSTKIHANIVNLPLVNETGSVCLSEAYKYECTIPRCSFDCRYASNGTQSDMGRQAKEVDSSFFVATQVSVTIDSIGNQFANCDAIMSFLFRPFDEPCQQMVRGTKGARDCSGMQGYACIAGIFALIFGSKRFISSDMANQPLGQAADDDAADKEKKRNYNSGGKDVEMQ